MYGNERIWCLVQMAGQIPQPSVKTSSLNPFLKPDIAVPGEVGLKY